MNPIKDFWRDLKIPVQRCSPYNLTELEWICREEWEKLLKYRCAKLVESFSRRLEAVIAAKGASTKCLETNVEKGKGSEYFPIALYTLGLLSGASV